jgi:ABC-type bacteriocin/lantibiotic exporter with double-glycine peptidase domain
MFGFIFLIGNLLYIFYLYYIFNYLYNKNYNYEKNINQNENFIIEILNNIDKIIFRGKIKDEIDNLKKKSDNLYNIGYNMYKYINNRFLILYSIIYITIFILIGYLIYLFSIKKIKNTIFITFLTILLLYRELILNSVQFIPDYIEFIARLKNLSVYFIDFENLKNNEIANDSIKSLPKELSKNSDSIYNQSIKESTEILNKKSNNSNNSNLTNKNLNFKNIEFININFKYKNGHKQIFNNFNKKINIDNKIIGLIGLSGNGKSTFAKLLIKMYKYEGTILIDNIDIKNINTEYLRKNIIYVNQNAKLFDKTIIRNIIYGCENNMEYCNKYLSEIMQFNKIRDLYKNIDFETTKAGLGGENLSGGQRQIINLINGLIIPSQIVILDEPTNALDPELKKDVIQLIKHFKKYKKCIIIISHDKDIFSIFDEKIEM